MVGSKPRLGGGGRRPYASGWGSAGGCLEGQTRSAEAHPGERLVSLKRPDPPQSESEFSLIGSGADSELSWLQPSEINRLS